MPMFLAGFEPIVVGLGCLLCQADEACDRPGQAPVVAARIQNVREAPSSLYCECNRIPGRNLVFDLEVQNRSNASATVYAFVWAGNDDVDPAERGLWPVSAVDSCLTKTGTLDVKNPTRGARIELKPNSSSTVKGKSILQPIGWFEGELVSFQTLRVEVWSVGAGRLFCQELKLDWRPLEEKPAPNNESPVRRAAVRGPTASADDRLRRE